MDRLIFKLPDSNIFDESISIKLVIPGKIKTNQRLALWILFVIYILYVYMIASLEGNPPITYLLSFDTLLFFILFMMAYYFSLDQYLIMMRDNSGWTIGSIKGNSIIRIRTLRILSETISLEIKQFSRKLKFTAIIRVYSSASFDTEILKFITINRTIKSIMEDLNYLDIPVRKKTLRDRPEKSIDKKEQNS